MSNIIQFPIRPPSLYTLAERQLIDLIGLAMEKTWDPKDLKAALKPAMKDPGIEDRSLVSIAESILALSGQGLPTDVVTVSGHMNEYGTLEEAGGLKFLSDIVMGEM